MKDLVFKLEDVIADFDGYFDCEFIDDVDTAIVHIAEIQSIINIEMDLFKRAYDKKGKKLLQVFPFVYKKGYEKVLKNHFAELKLEIDPMFVAAGDVDLHLSEARGIFEKVEKITGKRVVDFAIKQDPEQHGIMCYIIY